MIFYEFGINPLTTLREKIEIPSESEMDKLQKLMGTKWGHGCLKTYVKAEGVSYIVLENGDLLGVHRPNTCIL